MKKLVTMKMINGVKDGDSFETFISKFPDLKDDLFKFFDMMDKQGKMQNFWQVCGISSVLSFVKDEETIKDILKEEDTIEILLKAIKEIQELFKEICTLAAYKWLQEAMRYFEGEEKEVTEK